MSQPKPRRVNYRINYCSSEDGEHPVSNLVLQSAESKGWQTKRFAPFPQTIIIELLQLTTVNNISFLSHQTKICTKIEIQGKAEQDDNWLRLGYTTLESGLNTSYQSRQLRNVSLGGRVILLLKFTFHQNYANPINIFNQVGLIAMLVYGFKASAQKELVRSPQGQFLASFNELDRQTIVKLKNLQLLKRESVDNLRFDQAKNFKQQIENLKGHMKALVILQKQKKAAIKRQDFDQAKLIVDKMKKIRGPMVLPPRSSNSNQQFYQNYSMRNTPQKTPRKLQYNDSKSMPEDPENSIDNNYRLPPKKASVKANQSFDLNSKNKYIVPFDQIKIVPKDGYAIDDEPLRGVAPSRLPKSPKKNQQLNNSSLPSVKKVQRLTPQQFQECSHYFPVFNQITFEYLMSGQHHHRQRGIQILNQTMQNANFSDKRVAIQFLNASLFIVKKLITDKIISVLIAIIDFFGMVMKKIRVASQSNVQKSLLFILDKIAEFLGHNNQKFRQTCEDVFASLPSHPLTPPQLCYQILCQSGKDKYPRMTVGRLRMIQRIMIKHGISSSSSMIIQYTLPFLEDKNSQIRSAAIDLMVQISKSMGYDKLYSHIQHLKPHIIRSIQTKFQQQGGTIVKSYNSSVLSPNRLNPQTKQSSNPQYYCQYCKKYDKRLQNDDFRDRHLYADCLMITTCPQCNQSIQISALNNHLLSQCENHKYYKRCPKCKEAIKNSQYSSHTKAKNCLSSKAPAMANRCPLCHEDIGPGQDGWVKHLVNEKCPNNNRH